jgi:hypothetical protein
LSELTSPKLRRRLSVFDLAGEAGDQVDNHWIKLKRHARESVDGFEVLLTRVFESPLDRLARFWSPVANEGRWHPTLNVLAPTRPRWRLRLMRQVNWVAA